MDSDGAIGFFQIDEIAGKAFDVAIKDQTDELSIAIDDRRTGIPADDIGG